jgi:hypothetical protein
MKTKWIVAGLGICLLAACAGTSAVKIGTTPQRPAVSPDKVAVYRSADQVPGNYEEVALLTYSGDSVWSTEQNMWNSLKKKAGKLGANAIILDAVTEPKDGAKIVSLALFGGGPDRKGKAIAIYVYPAEK